MLLSRKFATAILAGAALLATSPARADVKLPAVFSDHMVLQQQMNVPVWGWADPGEDITVTFGQQKLPTRADEKGHWMVNLSALTANDKPLELTVSGKNKIVLQDILVGEVWLCSGQSNMEMGIQNVKDAEKEVAAADHPHIRLFTVPRHIAEHPQEHLLMPTPGSKPAATDEEGKWLVCTPQNVTVGQWGGFSACGYFFGRDLHNDLKVPVGLIHSSWGGTVAEAWTQRKHLEGEPDFAQILEAKDNARANYEKALAGYNAAVAKAKAADAANEAQKKASQPRGKPPVIKRGAKPVLRAPSDPAHNPNQASVLYNGMIQPIVPFAIRGAIWYQGESNASRGYQYRKLLPAMIKSWRDVWNEPDMAFYIVSLANFTAPAKEPGDDDWAELREAQAMTAAMPHNGQALAIDLADADKPGDIHPHNKQEVGRRLELVALAKTYGKTVDYSGPVYKDHKIEGDKVIFHFNFADGLTARGGEPIKGFQIAGEDKKWYWADAKIEGESIVVSSKDVPKPVAVRYDWAHNPQGNVYNKAGLPLAPFRTDDWVRPVAVKK